MRDPHDDLMLTNRDTTIVTQATSLDDTMPDPHGSSEDEEALFSDVGTDSGVPANKRRMRKNARGVSNRVPGMWLEADDAGAPAAPAAPASPTVAPSMPLSSMLKLVGAAIGVAWLARRVF
jgi:hypothetical protein